jgi:hypothetical protein
VVDDQNTIAPVCRILMAGGKWQVPPAERPANWREREVPVPYSTESNRAAARGIERWRKPSKKAEAA